MSVEADPSPVPSLASETRMLFSVSQLLSQILVGLLDVQSREDQSDQKVEAHRHPEIHDVKHVNAGSALHCRAADVTGEGKQPACKGCTDTAAELGAEGCAGVHSSVDALAAGKVGVLGAGSDQGVHVTLQRAHTEGGDGRTCQHQRNGTEVAGDDDAESSQCANRIAGEVKLVHAAPLGNKGRSEQKTDDHRDVDRPGENSEQVGILQDVGHEVDTHVESSGVDLHQDVGGADHQVIFVLNEKLERVDQSVFLLLGHFFLDFIFSQFFR